MRSVLLDLSTMSIPRGFLSRLDDTTPTATPVIIDHVDHGYEPEYETPCPFRRFEHDCASVEPVVELPVCLYGRQDLDVFEVLGLIAPDNVQAFGRMFEVRGIGRQYLEESEDEDEATVESEDDEISEDVLQPVEQEADDEFVVPKIEQVPADHDDAMDVDSLTDEAEPVQQPQLEWEDDDELSTIVFANPFKEPREETPRIKIEDKEEDVNLFDIPELPSSKQATSEGPILPDLMDVSINVYNMHQESPFWEPSPAHYSPWTRQLLKKLGRDCEEAGQSKDNSKFKLAPILGMSLD